MTGQEGKEKYEYDAEFILLSKVKEYFSEPDVVFKKLSVEALKNKKTKEYSRAPFKGAGPEGMAVSRQFLIKLIDGDLIKTKDFKQADNIPPEANKEKLLDILANSNPIIGRKDKNGMDDLDRIKAMHEQYIKDHPEALITPESGKKPQTQLKKQQSKICAYTQATLNKLNAFIDMFRAKK
jgi:hypothetical protein